MLESAPMFKVSLLSWIGNAAAALFGSHGSVTQQAQKAGCSRQTVYDHADKVQHILEEAHRPGPSRAQLLGEVQSLKGQLEQAQQRHADSIDFGDERRRRLVSRAGAIGISLGQTHELFKAILDGQAPEVPPPPSRATLGRLRKAEEVKATALLAVLDPHSQPLAKVLAADEMFCHGKPLLVG